MHSNDEQRTTTEADAMAKESAEEGLGGYSLGDDGEVF